MITATLQEPRARVCVVDDDPTALAAIVAALRQDFDVVVARSGEDALRLIERQPPDIVLLDVEMPGMDGLAVCRRLKEDPLTEPLPVVFLTAHSDVETELRGLSAGALDFIAKPPRGPAVVARVHNLVRLKRLAERLRMESQIDGLTGLHNRIQFDRMLRQELMRSHRHGRPLGLLMVDVDHFKRYNDHYGHLGGDGALRQVAQALKSGARRGGDLACRYGGEEFAMLLPDTDLAATVHVGHKLIDAVDALGIEHAASLTASTLTLSLGAACYLPSGKSSQLPPGQPVDDMATDLIARADAALYGAKHHGRHRVWSDQAGRVLPAAPRDDRPPLTPEPSERSPQRDLLEALTTEDRV